MRIDDRVVVAQREYLSIRHAVSAGIHARATADAERAWAGLGGPTFDERGWSGIIASATACVFSSAAMLDAAIQEIALDAREEKPGPHGQLAAHPSREAWAKGATRILKAPGTVEKYQRAREMAGHARADDAALEEIRAFLGLRNALVHGQPEDEVASTEPSEVRLHSLDALLAARVPPNGKLRGMETSFSQRFLAHGCAAWSLRAAVRFCDDFHAAVGLRPPYDHVRDRMDAGSP